jgi:hypothetical protein
LLWIDPSEFVVLWNANHKLRRFRTFTSNTYIRKPYSASLAYLPLYLTEGFSKPSRRS